MELGEKAGQHYRNWMLAKRRIVRPEEGMFQDMPATTPTGLHPEATPSTTLKLFVAINMAMV